MYIEDHEPEYPMVTKLYNEPWVVSFAGREITAKGQGVDDLRKALVEMAEDIRDRADHIEYCIAHGTPPADDGEDFSPEEIDAMDDETRQMRAESRLSKTVETSFLSGYLQAVSDCGQRDTEVFKKLHALLFSRHIPVPVQEHVAIVVEKHADFWVKREEAAASAE